MAFSAKTMFARDALEKMVAEALPPIDENHNKAIGGIVTAEGAKFVVSMQLGADKSWKLTGGFEHEWTGEDKVGIELFRTWKS